MTTPNIYRSRILNEISESDVGKTIRVAGWVENIRDHGGRLPDAMGGEPDLP